VETVSETARGPWSRDSWRSYPALQQPAWADGAVRDETLRQVAALPSLVFAGESRSLKRALAEVIEGNALVLQAGDCAEEFDRCHGPSIHNLLKVILQMSIILTYAGERRVVKIGRIAGQYAKPRSAELETVDGVEMPSYRGDMVNRVDPAPEARTPDAARILEGYFRATATLNLVRAFVGGGYAALDQVQGWSEASFSALGSNRNYEELVSGIKKAIRFMGAIGIDSSTPQLNEVTLYTSHEALLLEYEEVMTRIDTSTGDWYDTSASMLWIGDRTRQVDGAHVEFLRGVRNPIGVKVGPDYQVDDLLRLVETLNPENEAGRLTMITRFGVDAVQDRLPPLLRAMRREGHMIVWLCDPMHGNTYVNGQSQKTRRYEDILGEIGRFWQIHRAEGTVPGGVHLELTGEPVTECSGGSQGLRDDALGLNYLSSCDPRLNAQQAVELAFALAEIVNP
jgi:3-deoxy-7-phosphoheptulonate synthase